MGAQHLVAVRRLTALRNEQAYPVSSKYNVLGFCVCRDRLGPLLESIPLLLVGHVSPGICSAGIPTVMHVVGNLATVNYWMCDKTHLVRCCTKV
jgi:hypothetical protein